MPEFRLVFEQLFRVHSEIVIEAADEAAAREVSKRIAPQTSVLQHEVGSVFAGQPELKAVVRGPQVRPGQVEGGTP